MNGNQKSIRCAAFLAMLGVPFAFTGPSRTLAADPVIHVAWGDGLGPYVDTDYTISTTYPASVDFPDVKLITGSLTWRIWSTDTDNPDNIGDIGNITSPYPQNFGVEIEEPGEIAGAREVKGINLDPQEEGSDANYSNLTDGRITGNLSGDLYLQKSGTTGQGGVAFFQILGAAQGDITIPDVSDVLIKGEALGTIAADEITGTLQISGNVSGNVSVGTLTGLLRVTGVLTNTSLNVGGTVGSTGQIDICQAVGTTLTVNGDLLGDIKVTGELDGTTLEVKGDVGPEAFIDIANMMGAASLTFGVEEVPTEFAGDLTLHSGIKVNQNVVTYGVLTRTDLHIPTIDLKGEDVAGQLLFPRGGDGEILNGGAVIETVGLGEGGAVFSGTANFASVAWGADVKMCDADLDGTISIIGDADGLIGVAGPGTSGGYLLSDGLIYIGGNLGGTVNVFKDALGDIHVGENVLSGGEIIVGGVLYGDICADNLYPDECLPENINIQSFGPDWTVCDEPGCICDLDAPTTPSGEEGFDKNRYLSFVPGNAGLQMALRVTLTATDIEEFEDAIGRQWWIGSPDEVSENAGKVDPGEAPGWPTFWAATLQCWPYYLYWDAMLGSGTALHVFSSRVVPASTYEIQTIHVGCDPEDESNFSAALVVTTSIWGDVVGSFVGGQWQPPDGSVDIVKDVTAVLDKFKNLEGAPIKARCDVGPEVVNQLVEIADVTLVYEAFQGQGYPYNEPSACP